VSTRYRVPRDAAVRYAGAALDFNPIHLFDDEARAAGLPGVVVHGMYTLGRLGVAIERASGAALGRLAARFADPVRPGDAVEITLHPPDAPDGSWRAAVTLEGGGQALKAVRAEALPHPPAALTPSTPVARGAYTVTEAKLVELRDALEALDCATPVTFSAVAARAQVHALLADARVGFEIRGAIHTTHVCNRHRTMVDGQHLSVTAALASDRTRGGLRRVEVDCQFSDATGLVQWDRWTLVRRSDG
jgi:acyl dehydratase